jgi:hypothetical protein
MENTMGSIAVLLLILGFGSLVLNQFGYEFKILSWADDYQPWVGLGVGALGLVILVIKLVGGRGKTPAGTAKDA